MFAQSPRSLEQLLPVANNQVGSDPIQTVSARDLHAYLEVGKDFSTWIRGRIQQYEFHEGIDFVCSPVLGSEGRGGQNRKDYHLSLGMARELSMVERNEKGRQARRYFIECERHLRSAVNAGFAVPKTFKEALLLATEQAAFIEEQQTALEMASEKLERQRDALARVAPKAEFVNRYVASRGSMTFREVCKIIGVKEYEFRKFLAATKVMYQISDGTWLPYQGHVATGRLVVKTGNSSCNGYAYTVPKFTSKGLEWIAGEWGKHKAALARKGGAA